MQKADSLQIITHFRCPPTLKTKADFERISQNQPKLPIYPPFHAQTQNHLSNKWSFFITTHLDIAFLPATMTNMYKCILKSVAGLLRPISINSGHDQPTHHLSIAPAIRQLDKDIPLEISQDDPLIGKDRQDRPVEDLLSSELARLGLQQCKLYDGGDDELQSRHEREPSKISIDVIIRSCVFEPESYRRQDPHLKVEVLIPCNVNPRAGQQNLRGQAVRNAAEFVKLSGKRVTLTARLRQLIKTVRYDETRMSQYEAIVRSKQHLARNLVLGCRLSKLEIQDRPSMDQKRWTGHHE